MKQGNTTSWKNFGNKHQKHKRQMKINLIAVGKKMPQWIKSGFTEYAKRMPKECSLVLTEIAAAHRSNKYDCDKIKKIEWQNICKAINNYSKPHIIALDEAGKPWSTKSLAQDLQNWLSIGTDVIIIIGGADGLYHDYHQVAHQKNSLSQLTLPHQLVRVLIAEQIYRAYSLIRNHPYHRS